MEKMLRALYQAHREDGEQMKAEKENYIALIGEQSEIARRLRDGLSEEMQMLFRRYVNVSEEIEAETAKQTYACGFKDGVRLTDFESALISRILVMRRRGEFMTVEGLLHALDDE